MNEIHCDNEFRALMNPLGIKHGIYFNFANPQEHVPRAERNNRVIKERIRAVYQQLPHMRMCLKLLIAICTESTKKLNYFPAEHEVSKYYSPRMIPIDSSSYFGAKALHGHLSRKL